MITDQMIWDKAVAMGLDPWETEWLTVPAHVMYDIGSRGLPGRFSHWLHGKFYWRQKADFDAGRSRIYELVLPTRPALALLLEGNSAVEHLLVKAHVLAHVDFFRHNRYFAGADTDAHASASRRAERIRHYEAQYGREQVEQVLTTALALEQHCDPDGWAAPTPPPAPAASTDPYQDLRSLVPRSERPAPRGSRRRTLSPAPDILAFLIAEWPRLEDWERDLLAIVRAEALYFWPIRYTKVINEGWASYWHQQILRDLPLTAAEATTFARLHAGVTSARPLGLNPYHLGLAIWRSVARRFGHDEMFKIRAECGDLAFIRNYLDRETIEEEGLFLYQVEEDRRVTVSAAEEWERVRDGICNELASQTPDVHVIGAEPPESPARLHLHHRYSGKELEQSDLQNLLPRLATLIRGKVYLKTVAGGQVIEWICTGSDVTRNVKGDFEGGTLSWQVT